MDRTIRAGFIGCGGISHSHLRAVQLIEDAQVVAFCDNDMAHAEALAKANGGGDTYSDYRDLLARDDLDVVHIMTPHYLHAEMTLAALSKNLSVVCEKPMAIHMEDIRAMRDAGAKGRLGIVFQNRYNEAVQMAKRMLDSGELGAFQTVRAVVAWERDAAYYASGNWRGKWATEGGGSLINQSIHTVDLMYYLCGDFAKIKGKISTDLLDGVIEVEDNSHAVIEFANGQTGLLHTSNNFGLTELPQVRIYCEKGLLVLDGDCLLLTKDKKTTVLYDSEAVDNGAKACYGSGHDVFMADFYKSVREDTPFWLNGTQAYPAIWAVLGIYEASRTNEWVTFA